MVIIIIRIIIITSTLEKVTALWVWYKLGFTSRLILMDSRNDQEKKVQGLILQLKALTVLMKP